MENEDNDNTHSTGDLISPDSTDQTPPEVNPELGNIQAAPAVQQPVYPDVKPAPMPQTEHHEKGAHGMIAIVIAVLLLMTLVGIGFYAYDNSTNNNDDAATSQPTTDAQDSNSEADNSQSNEIESSDVDDGIVEIDGLIEEIEQLEGVDINELNDQNLEII